MAAGAPRGLAIVAAGALTAAVVGLVAYRVGQRERERVAAMPPAEAARDEVRRLRIALAGSVAGIVVFAVVAITAQTPQAILMLLFGRGLVPGPGGGFARAEHADQLAHRHHRPYRPTASALAAGQRLPGGFPRVGRYEAAFGAVGVHDVQLALPVARHADVGDFLAVRRPHGFGVVASICGELS